MNLRQLLAMAILLFGSTTSALAGPMEDVKLLPADTAFFAQLDFKGIQGSKLFKDIVSSHPMYAQAMATVKQKTGMNLEADLKSVTIAMFAKGGQDDLMIIFDAPFPKDSPAFKDPKNKKMSHAGATYYLVGKGGAVGSYKGRTIMTNEARMKTLLSGGSKGPSKALMALSNKRQKNAQIWVFGTPPQKAVAKNMEVKNIDASVGLKPGLDVNLAFDTNQTLATQAVTAFEAQKAQMAQNPMMAAMGVGAMIQKIKLAAKGDRVTFKVSLTETEVNQLLNLMKMALMKQSGKPAMIPTTPALPAGQLKKGSTAPQTTTPIIKPLPAAPKGTPIKLPAKK